MLIDESLLFSTNLSQLRFNFLDFNQFLAHIFYSLSKHFANSVGTIWNAPPNRHYPSYYMYTKWSDGFVGGYFDWIPMGMVQTGGGVGSTNTVYLPASNLNEVEVRIRIGFTDGVSRVSCR